MLLKGKMSLGFESPNIEQTVISTVVMNELDLAHALTDGDGIPMIVEILEGTNLWSDFEQKDGCVHVSVQLGENEQFSSETQDLTHYFWNERMLFMIPYSVIDLEHKLSHGC